MKPSIADELHPAERGMRGVLLGAGVNLVLGIIKLLAGFFGNSYALLADGVESFTDVATSIAVYFGLRYSARPPDTNHPYGHGKGEPIAASLVSIVILSAAILLIVESARELITPYFSPEPFTLLVLIFVIVVKEILFRKISKLSSQVDSIAIRSDAWHHRGDAITSAAAFVGISISLLGGPRFHGADAIAALFAAVIIIWNAVRLLLSSLRELTDEAPSREFQQEIRALAHTVSGVVDLDKSFVRKMGFDYFVDIHVVVQGDLSVREGHRIAHRVKDTLKEAFPRIIEVLVHIEPDDDGEE